MRRVSNARFRVQFMNRRKSVQMKFTFFPGRNSLCALSHGDLDPSKASAERSASSQLNSKQTQSGFVCIAVISTSRASAFAAAHLFTLARAAPSTRLRVHLHRSAALIDTNSTDCSPRTMFFARHLLKLSPRRRRAFRRSKQENFEVAKGILGRSSRRALRF